MEEAESCFVGDFVGDYKETGSESLQEPKTRRTVPSKTYPQRRPRGRSRRRRRCSGGIGTLPLNGRRGQSAWFLDTCRDSTLGWSAGSRIGAGPGCLFTLPRGLLKNRANRSWADEHAKPRFTFEISLSLNCTVILASRIGQFHADPITNRETGRSDEPDDALSSVGQGDHRARGDLSARHRECNDRELTVSIRRWPRVMVEC